MMMTKATTERGEGRGEGNVLLLLHSHFRSQLFPFRLLASCHEEEAGKNRLLLSAPQKLP